MDVNQKELAAILGITARRIRQLREEYGLFEHGLAAGKRSKDIASKMRAGVYQLSAGSGSDQGYNRGKRKGTGRA
ncbi:MAG: hypothetical protein ACLR78_14025 [Roseburia sp.]